MTAPARSFTVLHVDDDPDFADVAATFLEREDDRLTVRTATSAAEGLELLAAAEIDCIVADYDMPDRNGIEFLEAVREDHPDLPFILFTGKGSEEVAADAISAGVTDYLQKGGGTDQYAILANRVRNAVERYRIEREAERTQAQLQAIAENSADAIVIIDEDSRIRFANPVVEEYFGYQPAALEGEPLTTIMPERYREDHENAVERYVETGERTLDWTNVEFPGLHRDGTEIPLSVSYSEFQQDGQRRFIGIMRDITERKQIETQLRDREEQFRQLAENIQEVVWMSDPDKEEMLYVNPAYEEIWGQSVDSLYADPSSFLDAVHPADRQRVEAALESQPNGGYDESYRLVRPDGEQRWVRDRAVPVKNENGEVYRIVGIASDITARKKQTRQLETLISNLPGVVYRCRNEPDWPMEFVRGECESLTGYTAEALETGEVIWGEEILHPADQDRTWEAVQSALAADEPFEVTYRIRTSDGTTKWVWERGRLVASESESSDGEVLEGFITDITDRKEHEEQLQQERDRFRAVFEEAFDAMVIADDDGTYVDVNQSATELFGLPKEELLGHSIEEFAPEEFDFESAWQEFQESGRERGTFPLERPDGSKRIVEYAATMNVVPGQHLSVLRDVTERNARERELQRQNERLEEFASIVSHDLRNPLSVAKGRTNMAQDECDSEHLESVAWAHDRMEALIDDLLTIARQGEQVTETARLDLDTLAERCWRNVDTAEASIETDIDRPIRADRSRLQQLLENLMRNAIEHGGEDVTVRVGQLPNGFYVEDDGPGIPEEDREEIFEAGYTTNSEGTGFGLRIVEQIVEAHDWEISVTEGSAGGARFEITGVQFAGG